MPTQIPMTPPGFTAVMLKILFRSIAPPSVETQLKHLPESDEWLNQDVRRTIEVVIRDHVQEEDIQTEIAPGEKIGLPDGMEIRYARFKQD